VDDFAALAHAHHLDDVASVSPLGSPERYLYSQDMVFRYAFARWWGPPDLASADVWVMLNPATGDTEKRARPTLSRCMARSQAAGRSGLLILNLFAWRHTDPKLLKTTPDPVGPANDDVLQSLTRVAARTIVAWGAGGRLNGRSRAVAPLLTQPVCLGTTRAGEPRHPLYVPAGAKLVAWQPDP
jgi:hypothetical protein